MKRKYVVLNKFGRVYGVADSLLDIAKGLGIPYSTLYGKTIAGKPIRGQWLVMLREKHEYLWHKYGGIHGGDDRFAFCSKEELAEYKRREAEENDRNERLEAKQFLQRLLR